MEILKIDPLAPDPALIEQAAEAVLRGGVIAFPADTVYGLSCALMDSWALDFLFRLKRRPAHLSVISLISEPADVYPLAESVPESAEALMRRFWPGPLSLIFRASPLVPARARGERGTIALRVPKHDLSEALVRAVGGPLVSSSANLSGQPPARSAEEIRGVFGNQLDLILDGGEIPEGLPSTVVDVTSGKPELVRAGAIDVGPFLAESRRRASP